MIDTLAKWGKQFSVSFSFRLNTAPNQAHHNLIHFTLGGNCCGYGQRAPAVWITKDSALLVVMALNGKGNARFDWPGLVVGAWYKLELRQKEDGGAIVFEVIVNGMKVFSKENSQAREFEQMKVYASDPWYEPLPGQLKDLQYSNTQPLNSTSVTVKVTTRTTKTTTKTTTRTKTTKTPPTTTTILKRGQFGNPTNFFAKPWSEYARGFGDPNKEFWLGLTKMAELTATGQWELEVVLTAYNGTTYTALYSDFSVGDSSTNYRLSLSGYDAVRSSLQDSLIAFNGDSNTSYNLNGMAFSTKDRDHDNRSGGSCSKIFAAGGGWWFNNCKMAGLTGKNYNDITIGVWNGIVWYTSPAILPAGIAGSWPAAEMIIRKK